MFTEKKTQTGTEEETLFGSQRASGGVREVAGATSERSEE